MHWKVLANDILSVIISSGRPLGTYSRIRDRKSRNQKLYRNFMNYLVICRLPGFTESPCFTQYSPEIMDIVFVRKDNLGLTCPCNLCDVLDDIYTSKKHTRENTHKSTRRNFCTTKTIKFWNKVPKTKKSTRPEFHFYWIYGKQISMSVL